ncbi:putative baseplate assembly protein [Nocardia pseudovaccinii]|uniref:putative baseplate assembly protein n=1 Tax=Nocardia pseudovaccinii TaxID=189540 RepID=UPI0007A3A473|nr:putative baseplate assembly protein [Nocardia pseudovaccinii]
MTLPAPNLDDRSFQGLVDDAKRYVQQHCPEWSDHNVSDPGVTLLETYAMVVDQLLYRLNRVPDRLYLKFLELLGIRLFPPAAATVPVTFWLSAPREEVVLVPVGTQTATDREDTSRPDQWRTETIEPVVFATAVDLPIVPCALTAIATGAAGGPVIDRTDELTTGAQFACFSPTPAPDDTMYVGLSNPVPSCAVVLRFDCRVEGVGVDPRQPPLVWEAWDGRRWTGCELERDDTGGLNRPGDIVLHVPPSHRASPIQRRTAGWLRCRVVPVRPGQPPYTAAPRVFAASAFTIGGTVDARYAEIMRDEIIGMSEGIPAQEFPLDQRPVVAEPDEDIVVEVAAGDGWQQWMRVEHFGDSRPDDRHFTLDAAAGVIVFGPAIRQPDGSVTHYGSVPPKGAPIRVPRYRTGGGRRGNVARGTVRSLRSSLPYVSRIENRRPGTGGVDGETVENAKLRAPMMLRTRERAVTTRDYELLALASSPRVARAHCLAGTGQDAAVVRVLIVPEVDSDETATVPFERLQPSDELLQRVVAYLDERRMIGARLIVEPPRYRGVTVVGAVRARATIDPARVRASAIRALNSYLHPVTDGPSGQGWPLGRSVQAGELYAVLQGIDGVEQIDDLRLYPADPINGTRGEATQRITLPPNGLAYSFEHQIKVTS